jgi:predicted anti-sigma-YlaC factor YlaD
VETKAGDCAQIRYALGVYVLGAIEPADRALVSSHLARCRDCRDELAGLARLPALLDRVPSAEAYRICRGQA